MVTYSVVTLTAGSDYIGNFAKDVWREVHSETTTSGKYGSGGSEVQDSSANAKETVGSVRVGIADWVEFESLVESEVEHMSSVYLGALGNPICRDEGLATIKERPV